MRDRGKEGGSEKERERNRESETGWRERERERVLSNVPQEGRVVHYGQLVITFISWTLLSTEQRFYRCRPAAVSDISLIFTYHNNNK
jgi:hypothetical protein